MGHGWPIGNDRLSWLLDLLRESVGPHCTDVPMTDLALSRAERFGLFYGGD